MEAKPPPVPPPPEPTAPQGDAGEDKNGVTFCPEYVNRWGKRMIASDYGYTAWCFRSKNGRKVKP